MATAYRMGSEAAPGVWKAPGAPNVIPGDDPPPPPPPPPDNELLAFGTTLFGQSFRRYKLQTLGGGGNPNYKTVEHETLYGGNRGGAVTRVYSEPGDPISWSDCKPAYFRDGHPIIYSFHGSNTMSANTYKSQFRTFLDDKDETFIWLAYWHEWDKDNTMLPNGANFERWCNYNIWLREVLEEPLYQQYSSRNGGTVKVGPIATGGPFNKGTRNQQPNQDWRRIHDFMTTYAGRDDVWDFWGSDRYNPGWDGAAQYLTWENWSVRMQEMYAETGLPMIIGEAGSARATTPTGTIAYRDGIRRDWVQSQYDHMLEEGWFDASAWWRVPSTSDPLNAFATVMITPTGYNAELAAQGDTMQNGGPDAPLVVDLHSQYCIESIQTANSLQASHGQHLLTYYTGGLP